MTTASTASSKAWFALRLSPLAAVLLALGAASGRPAPEPSPAIRIEAARPVTADLPGSPQVEPFLAAQPGEPGLLLGAAVTFPDVRAGLDASTVTGFLSKDGGISWEDIAFPACRVDPWVGFGAGSRAYVSCLGEGSSVVVYRSLDGGRHWAPPSRVPGAGAADRPVLTVLSRDGERDTVVVAFGESFPAPGLAGPAYGPAVSRSENDGETFSPPTVVRHDDLVQQPFAIATLSPREVALFFMDFALPGGEPLAHRRTWEIRSDDLGRSFSLPALVLEQREAEMPWSVAADPRASDHGRLHVAVDGFWQRSESADSLRSAGRRGLFLLSSIDGGRTWSVGPTLTDTNAETPAIAVDREGTIGVTWYDTRRDAGERCFDLYFAASIDGGRSFLPASRVTPEPSCPGASLSQRGVAARWRFGGDYSGLAAGADGRFHLLWSDSRSGLYRVWTASARVMR